MGFVVKRREKCKAMAVNIIFSNFLDFWVKIDLINGKLLMVV